MRRGWWLAMAGGLTAAATGLLAAGCVLLSEGTLRVYRRPIGQWTGEGTRRDVAIRASDGVLLKGWFLTPESTSGRCVVVLHGIGDSRRGSSGLAGMFLRRGDSVLVPDNRAQGESGGELVTYGLLEKQDVLRWADWMRAQGCRELFGLGESLGGSVLIEAAAERPVFTAIAAECAFSSLEAVGRYRVRQLSGVPDWAAAALVKGSLLYIRVRYGLDLRKASAVDAMGRLRTPVLLIHGMADRLTPPEHSFALARAHREAVVWQVARAGHVGAYAANPAEFERQVTGWLRARSGT